MGLTALLNQTLTVVTMDPEGGTDESGNPIPTEIGRAKYPGRIQRSIAQTSELLGGRDTALSEWKAYLPADAVIGHLDQVIEGGRTFEVVGHPYAVQTPRGPHHWEVHLRLVSG